MNELSSSGSTCIQGDILFSDRVRPTCRSRKGSQCGETDKLITVTQIHAQLPATG